LRRLSETTHPKTLSSQSGSFLLSSNVYKTKKCFKVLRKTSFQAMKISMINCTDRRVRRSFKKLAQGRSTLLPRFQLCMDLRRVFTQSRPETKCQRKPVKSRASDVRAIKLSTTPLARIFRTYPVHLILLRILRTKLFSQNDKERITCDSLQVFRLNKTFTTRDSTHPRFYHNKVWRQNIKRL
jgi:hypothetical protein